jgi:RNA polymerase sigma factor (TIGR02999 family)
MPELTRLIEAAAGGDRLAADELLPLVYDELRRLAAAKMAGEHPGHTLNATALVHEAYLRFVGDQKFDGRGHFFAAAAEAMRRILVDRARERNCLKRGGELHRLPLSEFAESDADERLLYLDEALTRLATIDPAAAKAVELHHFGGLAQLDAAAALGISDYQFRQKWSFARAWLKAELSDS